VWLSHDSIAGSCRNGTVAQFAQARGTDSARRPSAKLPAGPGGLFNRVVPTDYALSPRLRARLMGVFLVLVGVLVCAVTVLVSLLQLPLDIMSALVLLVLVAVFVVGFLLTRRSYVVRAEDDGYRVRFVRGAGTHAARWSDVQDVVTSHAAGARCVVLRLRDGRSTTIPVDLLAIDGDQFVRELQGHLDRGHGYRRKS
jgi:hypothetical protein